ncbi:MAG: hypothetical protein GX415_06560 [Chloroflexi bacterium]|nr:metallophosphoesterase [Anaerolineaceae bacterium]NLI45052.1 hypothetical protein [Chloroflexota bacterium]HOT25081.1 metallophosphoesterase [Anaerolineaceae bacterium]
MSDLHFAESKSLALGGRQFNHNLPAEVYQDFFREIVESLDDGVVPEVDLVLAGDIFELTRSALWLEGPLRPYGHLDGIAEGGPLEGQILSILAAIAADERVAGTLEIIKGLEPLFQRPTHVHFIPGNHDRLTNATPAVRSAVRRMLGMREDGAPFDNQYFHPFGEEPGVLVRHGHEYDPNNFGVNLTMDSALPAVLPAEWYKRPVLGDITTLELAARLPKIFKDHYSDAVILRQAPLLTLYQRIMEFDNVRPANALMNFLFSTPGLSRGDTWKYLEPVFKEARDDIARDMSLKQQFLSLGALVGIPLFNLRLLLDKRIWKKQIPFWVFGKLIQSLAGKYKLGTLMDMVAKEECLSGAESTINCLVSGHTHTPAVELLGARGGRERFYLNSGTFRNAITSAPDMLSFGRLRSRARVLIYGPGERNPEYTRETGWSFDYSTKFGYGSEVLSAEV